MPKPTRLELSIFKNLLVCLVEWFHSILSLQRDQNNRCSGPGSRANSPLGMFIKIERMTLYTATEISFASVFGVVLICMIEYP